MEMFELRYFLAVAELENVNRAAENIHVSAGSLSKAISRLEDELQTPLFFKSGRTIRLTPEGLVLKKKAAHILQLEEDARFELTGREVGSLNVYISSEEILQTFYGVELIKKISNLFPQAKIRFLIRSEKTVLDQLIDGEVHLAIVTAPPPPGLVTKILGRSEFKTCASKGHPLVKKFGSKAIPIDEVLKYSFVSPDSAVLGHIEKGSGLDGWRDDKFPRQIKYKVCGLKLMENLIQNDIALGYLPDYFIQSSNLEILKVSGCPYSCHQTVRLIAKDPSSLGWLNRLWSEL